MVGANQDLNVTLRLRDEASRRLGNVTSRFEESRKRIGVALSGIGVIGIAVSRSLIRAAEEQQSAIEGAAQAVRNSGGDWQAIGGDVLDLANELQNLTGVADEQILRAFARLVVVTGDVDLAVKALPTVLDAAAASGSGVETVAGTLGRALSGAANTAESLGITFDENASSADRLAIAQGIVGGTAEKMADQTAITSAKFNDLKAAIGNALIPTFFPLLGLLAAGAQGFTDLIESLGPVGDVLGGVIGGLVLFAAVLGPVLIVLPNIISSIKLMQAAWLALNLSFIASPIGLIITAIIAAIVALVIVWKKDLFGIQDKTKQFLDNIVTFWTAAWDLIKTVASAAWEFLKRGFDNMMETISPVLDALGKVASIGGAVGGAIGGVIQGKVPGLQHGGIVRRPTLAVVGEAGPEAVIPLSRGGGAGMGGVQIVIPESSLLVLDNDASMARFSSVLVRSMRSTLSGQRPL